MYVPRMLEPWKIAPDQARALGGKTSATRALATAHSPPVPSATRKRKATTCHQVCENAVRQVKSEYIRIVKTIVRTRPMRSAKAPKKTPPTAPPTRNDAR